MKNAIRSILILAAALAAFAVPASAQGIDCRQVAVYDAATNGSTVLVAGNAFDRISICGYTLVGGGTATVKFVHGTGAACVTGETAITPAYSMVAQTVISDSSAFWRGLAVPPGRDLCIKTSAGVAVQAAVYFVQR